MKDLYIKLLGNPTVIINGQDVYFPYRKAEGLFYYICLNKKITREEAVNLLWADSDETSARKNLRDAIYKLKKSLGDNIFSPSAKSYIELNPNINASIDTDSADISHILSVYGGDFLQNFSVKDCYDFENWMLEKREDFKKVYISAILKKVNELVNIGDFKSIQKYADILISNDPYNEKTYRDIMRIYALSGDYNKAIKLYYDLTDILNKDLSISPEQNTRQMFREILSLKESASAPDEESAYFYGRYNELYQISEAMRSLNATKGISILITGEAGIGKTTLLNRVESTADATKYIVLSTSCYKAEEEFFLKPWHTIFAKLGAILKTEHIRMPSSHEQILNYLFPGFNRDISYTEFDSIEHLDTTRYEIALDAVYFLIEKLSAKRKLVLIFDDMQWMDRMSRLMLADVMLHFRNKNVILLGAYREDFDNLMAEFTVPLITQEILTEIHLERFTLDDIRTIIAQCTPNLDFNDSLLKNIYSDTEGNPLFLTELLKVVQDRGYTRELSQKAANIIRSRLLDLSRNEEFLLRCIALFFDKVSLESLKIIAPFDEMSIFDTIESLQSRRLIREIITDQDIFYSFTHQRIREYIYDSISEGRKKAMHGKIALYFEERFKATGNAYLYPSLIYHFERSGNVYRSLKYKIENLTDYYTVYHEAYPVLSSDAPPLEITYKATDFSERLEEIRQRLEKLDKTCTDYKKLNLELSYLSGRYYIQRGEYKQGLENIDTCIRISDELDNTKYLLKSYRQMIFYSIQVHDMPIMNKYLNKSLTLLEKNENIEEYATLMRLKGLYYIKTKNYNRATELLNESIAIFGNLNKINGRYSLSIAACHNYLGQMHKYLGQFEEAYCCFTKAIDFCEAGGITRGLGIFYSNAGQVLYEIGKFEDAQSYIFKSLNQFEAQGSIWGRDMSEGYAAMLEIENGNLKAALDHYRTACELSHRLQNPRALKLAERVKKMINT